MSWWFSGEIPANALAAMPAAIGMALCLPLLLGALFLCVTPLRHGAAVTALILPRRHQSPLLYHRPFCSRMDGRLSALCRAPPVDLSWLHCALSRRALARPAPLVSQIDLS